MSTSADEVTSADVAFLDEPDTPSAITKVMGVPLPEVREALLSGVKPREIDPEEVAKAIGLRLLQTESIDEVMDPESRNTADKLLDTPMWLRSVMFLPSTIDDAADPVFVVLDFAEPTGEPHVFSTSAAGVLRQVLRLVEAGALPRLVKLIEVGQEKAGRNRPLYLQDVKPS